MPPLPRHVLPHTDLEVSALCLGMAEFGTDIQNDAADHLAAAYLEAGGNFFDSAHCYAFWKEGGLGASERELGNVLRRLRGSADDPGVVIATKGGHPDNGPQYRRPDDFLSERVIAADIEDSLNRLGIERIPLFYLHRDDGKTPVGEIIEMLNREIARGRIAHIGASNWSVARIAGANAYAAAHGLHGFVASQTQWSLAQPTWTAGTDPTVRFVTGEEEAAEYTRLGVPIVAYSATAGGFFAGRGHDRGGYATPENRARYERAVALSKRIGGTPTQIALAYLMHQEGRVIPLFSTGNREHLAEAVGAAAVTLEPEQVRWLRDGAQPR